MNETKVGRTEGGRQEERDEGGREGGRKGGGPVSRAGLDSILPDPSVA
jgi:hypothetical protein